VFVDLDDFKVINDSLGHAVGDELLVAVTQRLRDALRPDDMLARFGGDEFVICLEGIGSERQAQRIADRIGLSLAAPLVLDDDQRYVTCSIGIALGEPGAADPDALLRDADLAMYRAKSQGKARAELFTDGLRQDAVNRLEIETGLRNALSADELRLVYQPEVDLDTGRVVAVEALLRWEHPTRGTISPAVFIPLAEVSGLIVPIGAWVLREACHQAAEWNADAGELVVSVNVSPRQLIDADFERHVADALESSGLAPDRLCLEITESAVIADPAGAVAKLQQLKSLGVRLALDDFGVGQSSSRCSCRSRRSRSTSPSSTASPATRRTRRSCTRCSSSRGPWAWPRWPRASRTPSRPRSSRTSAARSVRATTSPARRRRT
jgi:diguanylate cyclase (GGDEF)-like protein